MKIGLTRAALAALLLTAALPVYAHGSMEPRHGGVTQMTGEIQRWRKNHQSDPP